MQGVFSGHDMKRFPTKKALTAAVVQGKPVRLEATSIFGNEYGGPLEHAPAGNYYVVGPDPYTSRKWYAQIKVYGDGKFHVI